MQISTLEVLLYNYPMKILELVLDIVLLVLVYLYFFMPKWRGRGRESLIAGTLMYVYLSFVLYFTLMPVVTSVPNIFTGPWGTVNLHPFRDLINGYGDYWRQIFLNIILMIPMGILYPISRGNRGMGMTVTAGFIFSCGIEVLQPLLHSERCFDITDVVTNTLGAAVGYALLELLRPVLALVFPNALKKGRRRN